MYRKRRRLETCLTLYEQNCWFITDQITSSLCIVQRMQRTTANRKNSKEANSNVATSMSSSLSTRLLTRKLQLRQFIRPPIHLLPAARSFRSTATCPDFHFDTHHFVQRLEREGLNRAQAEGIMSAMAEVIDESIRNMTSNMVTKAEQEKVRVNGFG
jgi:hypothetical protein